MLEKIPSKDTIYRWIRVSGLLTLIPIILCVGPIAGYMAGDWLQRQFGFPSWTSVACAALGFLGGVLETVRVIRAALMSVGK